VSPPVLVGVLFRWACAWWQIDSKAVMNDLGHFYLAILIAFDVGDFCPLQCRGFPIGLMANC